MAQAAGRVFLDEQQFRFAVFQQGDALVHRQGPQGQLGIEAPQGLMGTDRIGDR